jgi:ribonuclease HI
MAAKKFYVVWVGRRRGVFSDWATTQQAVDKYPGARFKSFASYGEADEAFRAGAPPRAATRAVKKAPSTTVTLDAKPSEFSVRIYCDGACEPNPGNAGSGVVVYRNGTLAQLWYGLYDPKGTNNTAELNALHHALRMAEQEIKDGESVEVLSDSKYAINCIQTWAAGWERNGWRKAGGEIKNLDIIQDTYKLYTRIEEDIELSHVRAHAGTEGNELADRMAMYGALSKEVRLCQYQEPFDIAVILKMRAG